MKLTVLADNNTFIDQYYLGEPAVSYYIEIDDCRILFDTGYSDAFLRNAQSLGIDLGAITHLVLSHGHNDHTGGLHTLLDSFDLSHVTLIAHPGCFEPKKDGDLAIGSPLTENEIRSRFLYQPARTPMELSSHCQFLGEIPTLLPFEPRYAIGKAFRLGQWATDFLFDDSALVCKTENGLFVISGCSHSGICNITEYAMQLTGIHQLAGVIGGFHLFETGHRLAETIRYFSGCDLTALYPCHCVSLKAKCEMYKAALPIHEVGVGMTIN